MTQSDAEHNARTVVVVGEMLKDTFVGIVEEATRSVVEGSALTGAPGQPVDTGYLKASWQTVFDSPSQATIGTNTVYAPSIEDGVSYAHGGTALTLRSPVGGFHSVALTVAGMDRIKKAVVERVKRERGRG